VLPQPFSEVRTGVYGTILLNHRLPFDSFAAFNLGVQPEARRAGREDGRIFAGRVLDDGNRNARGGGCIHCPRNHGEGLLVRRVLDFEGAAKVLLLHVNEDEGAVGCAHGCFLPDGDFWPPIGNFSSLPGAYRSHQWHEGSYTMDSGQASEGRQNEDCGLRFRRGDDVSPCCSADGF
jgi:hypothetical protein